jgi:hypothetical protein
MILYFRSSEGSFRKIWRSLVIAEFTDSLLWEPESNRKTKSLDILQLTPNVAAVREVPHRWSFKMRN